MIYTPGDTYFSPQIVGVYDRKDGSHTVPTCDATGVRTIGESNTNDNTKYEDRTITTLNEICSTCGAVGSQSDEGEDRTVTTLNEICYFYSKKRIKIDAPPGKLGIVINTPEVVGSPLVYSVKSYGSLSNQVLPGDKLIRIKDVDSVGMSTDEVSQVFSMIVNEPSRNLIFERNLFF